VTTTVAVASLLLQPTTMPPRRKGAPKKVVRNKDPVPVDSAVESNSPGSSRPVSPQVPDVPVPPAASVAAPAGESADELAGEAPAPGGRPPPAPRSKRVRKDALFLTEDQEQDVADWYRSQELLYNRRLAEYKRTDIKSRILDEKAAELACTTAQLKTWIDSMRTAVGKLTDPTKKPSGGAAKVRSDRDDWIIENFGYLEKHIKRVDAGKRKKGGQLAESLGLLSSKLGTSEEDTEPEIIVHETSDDDNDVTADTRSKGGPFKGSSSSVIGAPPPTKRTSRRQQQASDESDSVQHLLQKASGIQLDLQNRDIPNDSTTMSKKYFTDMLFHEVMQMDVDSWSDYQAQALHHLMQFKLACRQKRQLQQQQQQQQLFQHQQMYPSHSTQMFAPPAGLHSSQQYPTAIGSSVGSSSQFSTTSSVGSSQQYRPASVGSSSQMSSSSQQYPTAASVGSSSQMTSPPHQQYPTPSVGSSSQMTSPPHQQQPTGIISQAWSLVAGPTLGRPAMSPVDCSTPQDSSMTSFLNSSLFAGDDQNTSFHVPTPPTTTS